MGTLEILFGAAGVIVGIIGCVLSWRGLRAANLASKNATNAETAAMEAKKAAEKAAEDRVFIGDTTEVIHQLEGLFLSFTQDDLPLDRGILWRLYDDLGKLIIRHAADLHPEVIEVLKELKQKTSYMIYKKAEFSEDEYKADLSDASHILSKELLEHGR